MTCIYDSEAASPPFPNTINRSALILIMLALGVTNACSENPAEHTTDSDHPAALAIQEYVGWHQSTGRLMVVSEDPLILIVKPTVIDSKFPKQENLQSIAACVRSALITFTHSNEDWVAVISAPKYWGSERYAENKIYFLEVDRNTALQALEAEVGLWSFAGLVGPHVMDDGQVLGNMPTDAYFKAISTLGETPTVAKMFVRMGGQRGGKNFTLPDERTVVFE